jgi:hypothetical protein
MCGSCNGIAFKNQGAYNDDKHPEDAKPYMDNNGASSESASVAEYDLPSGQNMKDEETRAKRANNASIGKRGFGD